MKRDNIKIAQSYARLAGVPTKDYMKALSVKKFEHGVPILPKHLQPKIHVPLLKRAENVRNCAFNLWFEAAQDGKKRKLKQAYFCRDRLCPVCQSRRQKRIAYDLSQVFDVIEREHPDLKPVFLTLTIRNCKGSELRESIDLLQGAFYRLTKNRSVERILEGYFRTLEVTYKLERDDWHPHIHALILVPSSYAPGHPSYIDKDGWIKYWQKALRADYAPSIDVQFADKKSKQMMNELTKPQAKVSKADRNALTWYVAGDVFEVAKRRSTQDRIVKTLYDALYRKRMCASGGIIAELIKQLKLKVEDGDLQDIGSEERPLNPVIEHWRYYLNAKQYKLISRTDDWWEGIRDEMKHSEPLRVDQALMDELNSILAEQEKAGLL